MTRAPTLPEETYVTLFMPRGFGLALMTKAEGGPFVVEYTVPEPSQHERCADNAERILWAHVAAHAPGVYWRAYDAGWIEPW